MVIKLPIHVSIKPFSDALFKPVATSDDWKRRPAVVYLVGHRPHPFDFLNRFGTNDFAAMRLPFAAKPWSSAVFGL